MIFLNGMSGGFTLGVFIMWLDHKEYVRKINTKLDNIIGKIN